MNTIADFNDMLQIVRNCIIDNLSDFEKDRVYLVLMDMEKKSVMDFLNTGWSIEEYDGIPSCYDGTYDMQYIYDLYEKTFRNHNVDYESIRDYEHKLGRTERYVMLEYCIDKLQRVGSTYYFFENIRGIKTLSNMAFPTEKHYADIKTHRCVDGYLCVKNLL